MDQLTEEELQKVVRDIDEIRKAKASNAEPAAKQLAGELAKEPKRPVQKPAATQPTCEAEPKTAPLTEEEIQEQQAQAKHERKKMHARNMRFYRSFTSYGTALQDYMSNVTACVSTICEYVP